jgi:hypothetical protein
MLQVFIDDSGRGVDPVFVLAGYVGRVRNWEEFSDRWQKALKQPPAIEYLKATEAIWLQGQFRGWKPQDRDTKVLKLIALIQKHSMYAVDLAVAAGPFRTIFGRAKRPFNKPHAIAFPHLVTWMLGTAAKRAQREKVRLVFDRGVLEREAEITEAYVAMMKHLPPALTSLLDQRPSFEDDKEVGPLQAADLWAWHVRRQYNEMAEGRNMWASPIWTALTELPTRTIPALGDEYLRDFRQRMLVRGGQIY